MASIITPRLGFLFPGHSAEDDYPRMAAMISPPVSVEVVHTTVGEDAHRVEALRDTGDLKRLLEGAEVLREQGVDAAMWACTSGSFVFGWEGAREQVQALEKFLGVPVSSTSLAFIAALQAMSLRRVAVAATYPLDIALLFSEFLERGGATVLHIGSLGIITGVQVGAMSREDVLRFVQKNDWPDTEAIVVPDTALHSARLDR